MNESILNIVIATAKMIGDETNNDSLKGANADTPLFGINGNLDSLGLVQLIAEVESRVSAEMGKTIVIANEKALSQKISPFRTVRSLAAYTEQLLAESE